MLGVPDEALAGGTVTARVRAGDGARARCGLFDADVALALTGAAGPEPHDGAPVGTIWVALVAADGTRTRAASSSRGERDRVRRWAEQAGLDLVRRFLAGVPLPASSLPGHERAGLARLFVAVELPEDGAARRSATPPRRGAPRSRLPVERGRTRSI